MECSKSNYIIIIIRSRSWYDTEILHICINSLVGLKNGKINNYVYTFLMAQLLFSLFTGEGDSVWSALLYAAAAVALLSPAPPTSLQPLLQRQWSSQRHLHVAKAAKGTRRTRAR